MPCFVRVSYDIGATYIVLRVRVGVSVALYVSVTVIGVGSGSGSGLETRDAYRVGLQKPGYENIREQNVCIASGAVNCVIIAYMLYGNMWISFIDGTAAALTHPTTFLGGWAVVAVCLYVTQCIQLPSW